MGRVEGGEAWVWAAADAMEWLFFLIYEYYLFFNIYLLFVDEATK